MSKQLKCFIACAFGDKEVDSIYSKSILPVLKKLNVRPLRVDKLNHNNNIDQKIVELIKTADFCIADLTFARPSVYYESGYIHGLKKEVIFIVRKDHFTPKQEDINGNLKIHFDLITKNIIDWTSPSSKFNKKLSARIKVVIEPLLKSKQIHSSEILAEKKFTRKSLFKKIEAITSPSLDFLKQNHFKLIKSDYRIIIGKKIKSNKHSFLFFNIYNSLTLNELYNYSDIGFNVERLAKIQKSKIGKIVLIFPCLNKVSIANVQKVFPDYNLNESNNLIIANSTKKKIIIINKIKSDLDFVARISKIRL